MALAFTIRSDAMQSISIFNLSTVVTDDVVSRATCDLQTQISRDFAPFWAVDANLQFRNKNLGVPNDGSWWLVILDDADQANAVGYHDLTPDGLPLGKVFARTDAECGHRWTVTASHELLEMVADPWMDRCCLSVTSGHSQILAYEVCDACEDDGFGYAIGDSLVSDFVLPSWFHANSTAASYDFCGHLQAPLQLLPGGYIGVYDPATGWSQRSEPNVAKQFDAGMTTPRQLKLPFGTRRERRMRKGLGVPLLRSGEPLEVPLIPSEAMLGASLDMGGAAFGRNGRWPF
jgi:hypothetical protein